MSGSQERQQALRQVLRDPRIWRGHAKPDLRGQRTGFADLDAYLPNRGWPPGSLIELLPRQWGIGELSLLLPALRAQDQCWVQPPFIPYAPALEQAGVDLARLILIQAERPHDRLWALEQITSSGLYSHVLAWHDGRDARQLRRLQLAAEQGDCRLFLFRSAGCVQQASPAPLRLYLQATSAGLELRLLKCRGRSPRTLHLPLENHHALALPASATAPAGSSASRLA